MKYSKQYINDFSVTTGFIGSNIEKDIADRAEKHPMARWRIMNL